MNRLTACLCFVVVLGGCSSPDITGGATHLSEDQLGTQVTLVGRAMDYKIGAALELDDSVVYIKDLHRWPDGYWLGGDKGKMVKVTGILGEDYGLPVFIQKKNTPPMQGIPVPEGTDLRKARHRYILTGAKWELLRE